MIITIGRQYGSGGRHIGEKLAETLSIKYYDKNLLSLEAQKSSHYDDIRSFYEEERINSLLYVIATTSVSNDHKKPFDFIKKIAEKEDCVIIGRCANFILRENEEVISIFIKSDFEKRAHRVAEYEKINIDKAKKYIQENDKERERFHKYYTEEDWKDLNAYDLVVDSGTIGLNGAVEVILDFINRKKVYMNQEKDF